jgi:hypothetical protein
MIVLPARPGQGPPGTAKKQNILFIIFIKYAPADAALKGERRHVSAPRNPTWSEARRDAGVRTHD